MQRIGAFGRRIIVFFIIPLVLLLLLVGVDRGSKVLFTTLNESRDLRVNPIKVLGNFFQFSYTLNSGSAYGFLSGKSWAQTFFKILTSVALVFFLLGFLWSAKKNYKTLCYSLIFIIGGTVGNFIDRLLNGKVVDFICVEVVGNALFGIFNLADVFLSVGVILVVVHFLFLDENALFRRKKETSLDESDGEDTDNQNEK